MYLQFFNSTSRGGFLDSLNILKAVLTTASQRWNDSPFKIDLDIGKRISLSVTFGERPPLVHLRDMDKFLKKINGRIIYREFKYLPTTPSHSGLAKWIQNVAEELDIIFNNIPADWVWGNYPETDLDRTKRFNKQ